MVGGEQDYLCLGVCQNQASKKKNCNEYYGTKSTNVDNQMVKWETHITKEFQKRNV